MQISRHWRLNPQRYRLEGFRSPNGHLSLQPRPAIVAQSDQASEENETQDVPARMPVPAA